MTCPNCGNSGACDCGSGMADMGMSGMPPKTHVAPSGMGMMSARVTADKEGTSKMMMGVMGAAPGISASN